MIIYNYDEKTKEYTGTSPVDYDPAEKERGILKPLVPANATLTPPPEYNEYNEIPVMQDGQWVIKPDYRKNYYSVNEHWLVEEIHTIGELAEGLYLVTKEVGEKIKENFEKFKIENGEIVELTEEEFAAYKTQQRQQTFEKDFFLTSLGYIRRSVNMATGETKDFICDIVPALQAGLTQGIATPIITYELPDFTKEITTEYLETLQEVKPITAEFLQECIMQLATDFMPTGLSFTPTGQVTGQVEAETEADSEESETDRVEAKSTK